MVCEGLTSRLEVANELVKQLGLKDEIKIIEVDSNYYAKEYFADRPNCERLINKRLDDLKLNIMRDWRVTLEEYLHDDYLDYLTLPII